MNSHPVMKSMLAHPFLWREAIRGIPLDVLPLFLKMALDVFVNDLYGARHFIREGNVVIDAGAQVGMFSLLAARRGARVYAFEPTIQTYELLRKRAKRRHLVTPVAKALGDEAGMKKIIVNKTLAGPTLSDSGCQRSGVIASYDVPVTTVDCFVQQEKVPRVDFIKMDVEGYERRVLLGAAETIRRFKPVIAMSAYHHPEDKEVLPRTLRDISPDYDCRLENNGEEDFVCVPR